MKWNEPALNDPRSDVRLDQVISITDAGKRREVMVKTKQFMGGKRSCSALLALVLSSACAGVAGVEQFSSTPPPYSNWGWKT
ncbi:hypothetical protein [Candidatus Halocynthiibacter alkanivorans]|uniref:hypothetical protein n=1 Tax=Candidatus Halocynthiibacter alkanivorans TaxID=2267619 RepID=UPI00109BF721|nr:hypothetical protein [Candidatus Halocynthiibacter alkanivorans]